MSARFLKGCLAVACIDAPTTMWAAWRTQAKSDFYTGAGGISGFQNGLAIAGD